MSIYEDLRVEMGDQVLMALQYNWNPIYRLFSLKALQNYIIQSPRTPSEVKNELLSRNESTFGPISYLAGLAQGAVQYPSISHYVPDWAIRKIYAEQARIAAGVCASCVHWARVEEETGGGWRSVRWVQ